MQLLTEKQVASLLALSPRTLQQWRLLGKGPPYVKVGVLVRYRESALGAWLDQYQIG